MSTSTLKKLISRQVLEHACSGTPTGHSSEKAERAVSGERSKDTRVTPARRKNSGTAQSDLPVRISLAKTQFDMDAVYRLTHERYVQMSYCRPRSNGRLIHYPHLENIPETVVLCAWQETTLVGTVSLTLDGPAGLPIDTDFKKEANLVRREGRRMASCWRIVTRTNGGPQIVKTLIECVVSLTFKTFKCVTILSTFHPRHEGIYRKLLNMTTVARGNSADGLSNAPTVLMRCDIERCPKRWIKRYTSGLQGELQACN